MIDDKYIKEFKKLEKLFYMKIIDFEEFTNYFRKQFNLTPINSLK